MRSPHALIVIAIAAVGLMVPMAVSAQSSKPAARLADEKAVATAKIEAARRAKAVPRILETGKTLHDLWALEVETTGKRDETKADAADLGEHAHDLIGSALDETSGKIPPAVRESVKVTGNPDFKGHACRATKLHDRAKHVLEFEYQKHR
jgi:hypothetical protein